MICSYSPVPQPANTWKFSNGRTVAKTGVAGPGLAKTDDLSSPTWARFRRAIATIMLSRLPHVTNATTTRTGASLGRKSPSSYQSPSRSSRWLSPRRGPDRQPVAAHVYRFRLSWRKSGIWLTHIGLILLIVAEGLSGILQRDNQMRINVGQTRRYTESFRETELAVIETTNPGYDDVVSIPSALLTEGALITAPEAALHSEARGLLSERDAEDPCAGPGAPPSIATAGAGTDIVAMPIPSLPSPMRPTGRRAMSSWSGRTAPSGPPRLRDAAGARDVHLPGQDLAPRPGARRDHLPFSITLRKFTHDIYPGTDIPKDFASTILLKSDDGRDDREVRIYMNNPLRYAGRAFYQAGYATTTTPRCWRCAKPQLADPVPVRAPSSSSGSWCIRGSTSMISSSGEGSAGPRGGSLRPPAGGGSGAPARVPPPGSGGSLSASSCSSRSPVRLDPGAARRRGRL